MNKANTVERLDEVNEFAKKMYELQEIFEPKDSDDPRVHYTKLAAAAADHVRAMKARIAKDRRESERGPSGGGPAGN